MTARWQSDLPRSTATKKRINDKTVLYDGAAVRGALVRQGVPHQRAMRGPGYLVPAQHAKTVDSQLMSHGVDLLDLDSMPSVLW